MLTKNSAKANLNIIKRYEFKQPLYKQPVIIDKLMEEIATKNQYSVSRIPIDIIINKKGIIKAELIRHLAPLTISELLKNLPIRGNIYYHHDGFSYVRTNLNLGTEKQKKVFKIGDLSYLPSNSAICFFKKETGTASMNHIGKVISNMDMLTKLDQNDIVTIQLVINVS